METKILADSMLGRLAKWLRVMGHDTYYQSSYPEGSMNALTGEGRRLLTRTSSLLGVFPDALIVHSNRIQGQIQEALRGLDLPWDRSKWFTRCLRCNVPLEVVSPDDRLENVPDYVLYENPTGIRRCGRCHRYYWPGSHRQRMLRQLEEWGLAKGKEMPLALLQGRGQ